MAHKSKHEQLNSKTTYGEYDCPICGLVQVKGNSSKEIKYWHDIESHPAVEPAVVVPEPVIVVAAKPKAVRKPKAIKPEHMSLEDMLAVLVSERKAVAEAITSTSKHEKEDADLATMVDAINDELIVLRDVQLPMLMSVSEEYRDNKLIAQKQRLVATLTSELVFYMSKPEYLKGKKVKDTVAREERLKVATLQVNVQNAAERSGESKEGASYVSEETERFNAMLAGDIWIPRPKREPKHIPFCQDIWWALQTHAKYGIKDEAGNYLREPILGKDRTWEALAPIVAEVFDELMDKYSFDFSEKKYDIRASIKKVDEDGFVIDAGSEVITRSYALPHDEWLGHVSDIMHKVWKKTWNRRETELANVLADLGYYGSGKEDLGREYCSWAGNVSTKVLLGNMSNMQYAILEAQGKLPKDDPKLPQTKATSRRRGK
jgi:hypothetical protein